MKVVISAGGRFHAINLANQLQDRGLLKKLFSFSYVNSDRKYIDEKLVHVVNLCKFSDIIFAKLRLANFVNRSVFNFYKDDIFDLAVSKKIENVGEFELFVGWANNSLRSLKLAKKSGAKTVIESGSCHIIAQNNLIRSEYEKWGVNFMPTYSRVVNKMCEEYNLADYIMTLSDFSRQSFINQGVSEKKVLKVSCGIDVDYFSQNTFITRKNKFRVVFVGLVCLRKGVQYLIEAWNKLNLPIEKSELLIIGNIQKDFKVVLQSMPIASNVIFYNGLDKVRLKRAYETASLFVLPSIEDGFGMVVGEAMASGLPVICTKNAGASEVVKDFMNGFVIGAADSDELAEKIMWCYKNQDELLRMGAASRRIIRDYSWLNYGNNVVEIYNQILGGGEL